MSFEGSGFETGGGNLRRLASAIRCRASRLARAVALALIAPLLAGAVLLAIAAPTQAQALTAEFQAVPASHDGSSVFTVRLAFTEEVFNGTESFDKNQAIQDALQVSGGTVRGRRRVERGSFDRWIFRIRPSGNGAVTLTLPETTGACSATGAICTPGGTALSNAPTVTVPGPATVPEISISAGSSTANEGGSPSFTLTRTGFLTGALTVNVDVSENGAMLKGTPADTVTFGASSATADLSVETEDDEVVESASVITASISAGSGYSIDSSAAQDTVTVADDDAAPVITSAGPFAVAENGTAVATLAATDNDTSVTSLNWSLAGGADQGQFILNSAGVLAFAAAKDFEAPDDADEDGDYEVTVRVTDGANPVEATLTVSLTDVDDAAPVITSTGPFAVPENGTAIATLTATDQDTAASGLSWSVTGGADQDKFTLSSAGVLAFAAAKDFEAPDDADEDGDYEVEVRVTDGANPVEATLTVSLTDVDEVAPTLLSAGVTGDSLTLKFDEPLDGNSVPGAGAFSVAVDGTARTVDAVAALLDAVTLTLASAVVAGETVTLGYTAPAGPDATPLKDLAGNELAGFSGEPVTNHLTGAPLVGLYSLSSDWSEAARSNFRVYLVRYGDTAAELTVNASVTETGSMLVETPPSSFTFAAGSDEIKLEDVRSSLIVDDLIDEPDSEVTITILAGTGYRTSDTLWGGPSLTFTVRDNDTSPVITTASTVSVKENRTAITKLTATRTWYGQLENGDQVKWSLTGGADEDKVTLSEDGDLAFKTAKDFEAPDDADTGGDYEIEVRVTDAAGNSTDGTLTIRLTDVSSTASGQPAISGTGPQAGNVLTATKGTVDDDDGVPATLDYQWVHVDGGSESDIAGATSDTYTLGASDVGKQVKVKASFTDNGGNAEGPLASDAYPSTGTVAAARRACPSDADWCAEMTVSADVFEYQSQGYDVTYSYSSADGKGSLSDNTVSHRDVDYTVTAISRNLVVLDEGLLRMDSVMIGVSGGELPDGTVFTVAGTSLTVGADSNMTGLDESWYVTALSLPHWFQGKKVTVSLKFPANSPPAGLPRVSGTEEVGETLTASADGITDDDGLTNATFTWQWVASDGNSDTAIAGATASTYTLTSAEVGKTVKASVTFTDDRGVEATLVSAATDTVLAANVDPTGLPTISGTVRVGETLTASADGIADGNGLANATFSWRWLREDRVDTWNTIATGETCTLTDAEAGKPVKVLLTFTDDAGHDERLLSDATEAVAAANTLPTGLPTISGTARVGETLTASANGIADADGLANATFAWQWLANDGTSDAEIADATAENFTLTAAEEGKTVKVRLTFTDDLGAPESLVSEATAEVTAALPVISIAAVSSPVTEGSAAAFTLSRTGDAAAALTLSVAVSEAGSVLSGTPASTVTFAAGEPEATLSVATDDDGAAEADGRVTATVSAGTGYEASADASSATVDVYDNDEATVETLWTSTMTVQDVAGALLGYVYGSGLNPNGWTEDGKRFDVDSLRYFAQYRELAFTLSAGPSDPEQLTLHLDDLQVQLGGASGEKFFYWTVDHPGWQEGGTVAVTLTRTDPDATVVAGPGISVADAQVQEAEGAVLAFRVTLAEAQTSAVSVRYATSDVTATAGSDYVPVSGALRFAPGETAKTVSVPVLNDSLDDDGETLTLTLSDPFGATIADGAATGTINNTDPMPRAWIARFGRTVADQVVDAVTARMAAPRRTGIEAELAGQALSFRTPGEGGGAAVLAEEEARETEDAMRRWMAFAAPEGLAEGQRALDGGVGLEARALTRHDVLAGTSFALTAEAGPGGFASVWGRGAATDFDGREGDLSLDGSVTTAFLGADWTSGPAPGAGRRTAGLAIGRSRGSGGYRDGSGAGDVEATLTGLYPYAGADLGERLSAWAVAGYGTGDLTVTPEGRMPLTTGLSMRMGAAGLRGELLGAADGNGFALAMKGDARFARTESDAVTGADGSLAATEAGTWLARVGVEGSRSFALEGGGASLTPTFEFGLRRDGGDAETGLGADIGVGLVYADPGSGLTFDVRARGLVAHEAQGFRERGASASLVWDPRPGSDLGPSLSLGRTLGASPSGGMDALLSRETLAGLAADGSGAGGGSAFEAAGRVEGEFGYGMPAFGGRFTGTPNMGFARSDGGAHNLRVGWRLTPADAAAPDFDVSLDATRREPADDDGSTPAHSLMLRGTLRW